MKHYEEIMNKITVTDEMKKRILKNIQEADASYKPKAKLLRYHAVKRFLPAAACFVLLLASVFTVHDFLVPEQDEVATPGNGIVTVSSTKELADKVGFEMEEISDLPFHVKETVYTSYWDNLGEVSYIGEEQTITMRKSAGEEDNSGDYTVYDQMINSSLNGHEILLKGNGDLFYLAVWSMDGFSYSVSAQSGISEAAFNDMITGIISKSG